MNKAYKYQYSINDKTAGEFRSILKPPLLLDEISDCEACYSFRRLRNAHFLPCLRLVREIDGEEKDFYFNDNNELDVKEIERFALGFNLNIKIWYDQSGNDYHLIQEEETYQPLFKLNDLNSIRHTAFFNIDKMQRDFNSELALPNTISVVGRSLSTYDSLISSTNREVHMIQNDGGYNYGIYNGVVINQDSYNTVDYAILTAGYNVNDSFLRRNGEEILRGNAGNYGMQGVSIGMHGRDGLSLYGNLTEVQVFNRALSSEEIEMLEANHNQYYNFY